MMNYPLKHQFKLDVITMIESGSKDPVECPVCDKKYKVYWKSISSRMAITLIDLYLEAGKSAKWVHLPTTKKTMCQNYQDLRFWGLIEEGTNQNRRGGKNSGYWRVTRKAHDFIKGHLTVSKYRHIYLSECVGESGEQITFRSCFKEGFDFPEFMSRPH